MKKYTVQLKSKSDTIVFEAERWEQQGDRIYFHKPHHGGNKVTTFLADDVVSIDFEASTTPRQGIAYLFMSRKAFVVVLVILIFLALVLINKATTIDAEDLSQYANSGRSDKLVTFLNDHWLDRGQKRSLVNRAIELICERKFMDGLTLLEARWYQTDDAKIIATMNRVKATFPDFDRFWNACSELQIQRKLSPEMMGMLKNFPASKTVPSAIKSIENLFQAQHYCASMSMALELEELLRTDQNKFRGVTDALTTFRRDISVFAEEEDWEGRVSYFKSMGLVINNFAIKRRFGEDGSKGVYDVINMSTYQPAVLLSTPEMIPANLYERVAVRLVVYDRGERPYQMTNGSTEYFRTYEVSTENQEMAGIIEKLGERKGLLKRRRSELQQLAAVSFNSLKQQAEQAVAAIQP